MVEYGVPTEHIPSPMTISCVHSPQQLSQHRASGTPSVDEPFSSDLGRAESHCLRARVSCELSATLAASPTEKFVRKVHLRPYYPGYTFIA